MSDKVSSISAPIDWLSAPAYVWSAGEIRAVPSLTAPALDLLKGVDRQKALVVENVARLARGHAAHDMLLWGARGMGKSALLRAAVRAAQVDAPRSIALVQASGEELASLPALFRALAGVPRNFLVFLDDLGFDDNDKQAARRLRTVLDGGIEARPPNVRLAVTSNRRAIMARDAREQDDPLNPRDAVDDMLALADRFGLSVGYHVCSQDEYLEMIEDYARTYDLPFDAHDALEWSRRRGARSGRVAWHYITELAGRSGRTLG